MFIQSTEVKFEVISFFLMYRRRETPLQVIDHNKFSLP